MDIPTSLHERGRAAYAAAVESLRQLGENPEPYAEPLLRYARACDSEQTALDAWEIDGRPMHALGSTGALVAHPISKAVREAEIHAAKMARELGLSPESRAAMGRTRGQQKGASTAPDRKLRAA